MRGSASTATAPYGGDLKVLVLGRLPGMFHSAFTGNSSTLVHSWVESDSIPLVSYGHQLDCVPFSRLQPVLMVNINKQQHKMFRKESSSKYVGGI